MRQDATEEATRRVLPNGRGSIHKPEPLVLTIQTYTTGLYTIFAQNLNGAYLCVF